MQISSRAPNLSAKSRYLHSILIRAGGQKGFGKTNQIILDLVASMMDEHMGLRVFPQLEILGLKQF
jgi:hypothetical protein